MKFHRYLPGMPRILTGDHPLSGNENIQCAGSGSCQIAVGSKRLLTMAYSGGEAENNDGSNLQAALITASASNPANSSSPASRLDLKIRRQRAGSLISRLRICQTRCAANAASPIHAGKPAPASASAAPIKTTASP